MIKIQIRPYGCELMFTQSRNEFRAERAKYTADPIDLDTIAGCASDFQGGSFHIVGVFDGEESTLVHELSHVTIKVMHHIGTEINDQTCEPFCYLLEDLFLQCIGSLKETTWLPYPRKRRSLVSSGKTVVNTASVNVR